MDNNRYPIVKSWAQWPTFWWGLFFFCVINWLVWIFARGVYLGQSRLDSPVSFREIESIAQEITADSRPKVVFLGASSMWGGGGIREVKQTIPALVGAQLATGTVMYNLSFPAARPLDLYLLMYRLRGHVDLFVVDISTAHLGRAYGQGVTADRTKYLRVQNLLATQVKDFIRENPSALRCLNDANIYPKQEIFVNFAPFLPIVQYKDVINRWFFGKHFSLFISDVIGRLLSLRLNNLDTKHWAGIVSPPLDVPPAPGATSTPLSALPEKYQPSLNSCLTQSMAEYVELNRVPVIFYLSPHSPASTALYRTSGFYKEQISWVKTLYGNSFVLDPDTQPILAPGDFYDETHFYPTGHEQLSSWLVAEIKKTRFNNLLR